MIKNLLANETRKLSGYAILWSAIWIIIAVLAFFQDYLSSLLNNSHFIIVESISYKFFWLLFIPVTLGSIYCQEAVNYYFRGYISAIISTVQVLITSLVHLILFSIFLITISKLIHDDPWKFSWLITEKLSTRLYITLSVYAAVTVFFFRIDGKASGIEKRNTVYPDILTVKNGRKSEIIRVDSIKVVKSEGGYITLFTDPRKYVMFKSLKTLMNELHPDKFKRIHKSSIVNIDYIASLKSRLNGDYDITMKDGTQLRLSRNYVKNVKGILL